MDPPKLDREAVLSRFDTLLTKGELLWTPSLSVENLVDNGFAFEFRVCPSQSSKPAFPTTPAAPKPETNSNSTSSTTELVRESDIDNFKPEWQVAQVNGTHRVILNKFCIYRPQYILLTASPSHLQTSPLELADFAAAWTMLDALEAPHYVIFNCARQAGGSRMHKHMQVFEQEHEEMLPDRILKDENVKNKMPYRYSLQLLDQNTAGNPANKVAKTLLELYTHHLQACKDAFAEVGYHPEGQGITPHNIVLTKRWLMTIPRREAGLGIATANAAGFMGLVWVSREEVVELWKELGPASVLAELGVPA